MATIVMVVITVLFLLAQNSSHLCDVRPCVVSKRSGASGEPRDKTTANTTLLSSLPDCDGLARNGIAHGACA
jgi:hypothetical protein